MATLYKAINRNAKKKVCSRARANYNTVMLTRLDYSRIDGCLGIAWAVEDVATGTIQVLGTKIPFEGESNKEWQWLSSMDAPVQGKSWKYFGAPKGRSFASGRCPCAASPAISSRVSTSSSGRTPSLASSNAENISSSPHQRLSEHTMACSPSADEGR